MSLVRTDCSMIFPAKDPLHVRAEVADRAAAQAVAAGVASSEQQQRFVSWVVRDVAARDQIGLYRDNRDAQAFMAGRQFVGTALMEFIGDGNRG